MAGDDLPSNGEPTPDKQDGNRDEQGRFRPGVSGNPIGRPKATTVTETLRKLLEETTDVGMTYREAVARRLLMLAVKGDMRAMSYLVDRVDGKALDVSTAINTRAMELNRLLREMRGASGEDATGTVDPA